MNREKGNRDHLQPPQTIWFTTLPYQQPSSFFFFLLSFCRSGRKLCLLATIFINAVSGVLMALAPSYTWTVIFCLLPGLVSKGGWLTGYVLSYSFLQLHVLGSSPVLCSRAEPCAIPSLRNCVQQEQTVTLWFSLPDCTSLLKYSCIRPKFAQACRHKWNDKEAALNTRECLYPERNMIK